MIEVAQLVLGAKGAGQDRVAVVRSRDGLVAALADGAGGTSEGALAAENAVRLASTGQPPWVNLIRQLDKREGGQCALVVAAIDGTKLSGASVGDCEAWLIADEVVKLTAQQIRKPLAGSGACAPVAFEADFTGTLLLGSDGLFNYVQPELIIACARKADLHAAAEALVSLPRLRSGKLPDDVSVILCRGV